MNLFIWTDSLSVGNSMIDSDHKNLIDMINAFHNAVEQEFGYKVIGDVLGNLVVYSQGHFHREELKMVRLKYPQYLAHKQEHTKLLRELEKLYIEFMTRRIILTISVSKFLKTRLLEHIINMDKQLADAIPKPI